MFEGFEYDYEEADSNMEADVSEQVKELEKLKEQYMTEALEKLLAIGDEQLMKNAIDTSENAEKLLKWKERLLEDSSDDAPDAKKLVLRK